MFCGGQRSVLTFLSTIGSAACAAHAAGHAFRDGVRATGLLNWSAVEQLLNDHLERKANLGYHLWGLMVLLLWIKQWNVGLGSSEPAPSEAVPTVLDQVGSL